MTERTPLHDVHTRLRGSFTDFAGWSMPVKHSSETAEHHSVRTVAGIFRSMSKLRLSHFTAVHPDRVRGKRNHNERPH